MTHKDHIKIHYIATQVQLRHTSHAGMHSAQEITVMSFDVIASKGMHSTNVSDPLSLDSTMTC